MSSACPTLCLSSEFLASQKEVIIQASPGDSTPIVAQNNDDHSKTKLFFWRDRE
jgi:hypothetical protein